MSKPIGIKEKERERKNVVSEMISTEVLGLQANDTDTGRDGQLMGDEAPQDAETMESLKKQLEEARAALEVRSTRKTRVKDTRVNLLMYKDTCEALKKECKKQGISVNDCMNQLAEKWIRQQMARK